MTSPFIGQIIMFGGNFAPLGYAFCNGQLLSIAQNSALYSLIGTAYGGDGQTTFGLPNLQGRVPLDYGQGPGLSNYAIGQTAGTPSVTLITNQIAGHNHLGFGSTSPGSATTPSGTVVLATVGGRAGSLYNSAPTLTPMTGLSPAGGNQPHENEQPYLAISFCIALEGIFPSRN